MADLLQIFVEAIQTGNLAALSLSRPAHRSDDAPVSLRVRPVALRQGPHYQWTHRFPRHESHENLNTADSISRLRRALDDYRHVHWRTPQTDGAARANRKGIWRISSRPAVCHAVVQPHNREKQRLIPEGTPCPFLEAIGVMTSSGQVRAARQAKFRQINRFLEFVDDIYRELPQHGTLSVVDFGCGKSYLTFALHHLLTNVHGRDVAIVGLDRRPDVIRTCTDLVERLKLQGLDFQVGDIGAYAPSRRTDLAVSLHACDTATDDALAQAVAWEVPVILAVPCCQHEIAQSMTEPTELLEHGILKERFAAMVTDALRAAALKAAGYSTQVIEFIDLEHTPKNVLIRAVRRSSDQQLRAGGRQTFAALKSLVGVTSPYIESALPLQLNTPSDAV